MAKPRINLRFEKELLDCVDVRATLAGLDRTSYMEVACAEKVEREVREPIFMGLRNRLLSKARMSLGGRR